MIKKIILIMMVLVLSFSVYAACPDSMVSYWQFDEAGKEVTSGDTGLWSGLVSLWHLDESSGTIVDAKSSNDGTYNGALYSQDGVLDASVGFDGINDYVDMGDISNPSGAFSLSIWVNPSSVSGYNPFVTKGDAAHQYPSSYNFHMNGADLRFRVIDDVNGAAIGRRKNGIMTTG